MAKIGYNTDMVSYHSHDRFEIARQTMENEHLRARGISDGRVLRAMRTVPREVFIPGRYHSQAYSDCPLPIGCGQTISQPYIVALMTQALGLGPQSEVLEIGTGCGYQTAILAAVSGQVYTMERHHELLEGAQSHLETLGIDNVQFAVGDGTKGWPDAREFDGIIVTAAAPDVPKPLVDQIGEGGTMVIPVGGTAHQELVKIEKHDGKIARRVLCGCRFVKLIGEYGFSDE